MNLKNTLIELKEKLLENKLLLNRDYEFNEKLEDHQIPNSNVYRLFFVEYYRAFEYPGRNDDNINTTKWVFKPFLLPNGMRQEEAFKVLSYFIDYIGKPISLKKSTAKNVAILNELLDIDKLGFTRIDNNLEVDDDKIINLFVVSGRTALFKKNDLYNKYFKWYHKGVTLEEVIKIYHKCGLKFHNLLNLNINKGYLLTKKL